MGETPITWSLVALSGDVAVQRAVQRVMAREGDDRNEVGREGFADRARRHEAEAAVDLERLLHALRIDVDASQWTSTGEVATRAARVAFVRLYEAGVITRSEAVLDTCPSCQTVVDQADTDTVDLEVEAVRIALEVTDGRLEIDLPQPELLVGAVAIAVPATSALVDSYVLLPLLDAEVPVVSVEGLMSPVLVVPGHDSWSYDLARQLDYPVVQVLDTDGIVRQPGPLEGLTRYAARSAALDQLAVEGYVVATVRGAETVHRCHRCGTVLIPALGRHWLLDFQQLIEPVIADVEAGAVTFEAVGGADNFLAIARHAGTWSVSQQLWAGQPIPVSSCLDCGATRVSVEEDRSCGVCMGTLVPHDDVLDARFVAAVTPLAMTGWPNEVSDLPVDTTLCVGASGLFTWALAIACVGKRLSNRVPYSRVLITDSPAEEDPGPRSMIQLLELVETYGAPRARIALAKGSADFEVAPPKSLVEERAVADALAEAIEHLRTHDAGQLVAGVSSPGVLAGAFTGE